jgi:hypothetical protein
VPAVRADAFVPVPNRGMITISIMLANIMQGVDNTILGIKSLALPPRFAGQTGQVTLAAIPRVT